MDKILDVFNYKSYFYWMKKRLSVTKFSSENNLPMFRLNAAVIIRVKVKRCEQTLLFIAMHYWGYTSSEVRVGEDCSSLPASSSQWSSNQGLPVLHPGWSASLRVSSGCAGPPSPTAPVLCHAWSSTVVSSQLIGWWFSHAWFATADLSIIPFSQFLQSHLQSPSGLHNVDLAATAGDMICPSPASPPSAYEILVSFDATMTGRWRRCWGQAPMPHPHKKQQTQAAMMRNRRRRVLVIDHR